EAAVEHAVLRGLGADAEVTAQGDLKATREAIAVDRADDRLVDIREARGLGALKDRVPDGVRWTRRRRLGGFGLAGHLLQIAAGAERASASGEDGDVGGLVVAEARKRLAQRLKQPAAEVV